MQPPRRSINVTGAPHWPNHINLQDRFAVSDMLELALIAATGQMLETRANAPALHAEPVLHVNISLFETIEDPARLRRHQG